MQNEKYFPVPVYYIFKLLPRLQLKCAFASMSMTSWSSRHFHGASDRIIPKNLPAPGLLTGIIYRPTPMPKSQRAVVQ